jgi:hypothetical protein
MTRDEVLAAIAAGMKIKRAAESPWPTGTVYGCPACNEAHWVPADFRPTKDKDLARQLDAWRRAHFRFYRDREGFEFWGLTRHIHGQVAVPYTVAGPRGQKQILALQLQYPDTERRGPHGDAYWRTDHLYAAQFIRERFSLVQAAGARYGDEPIHGKPSFYLMPYESYRYLLDLFHNGLQWDEIIAVYETMRDAPAGEAA